MSKAVLISIKPKWVEKIASGEKTVEVRRTAPQLWPPFKCYIYCTRNARDLDKLWVLNEQRRQEYGGLTAVCANLAERPNCHYCGNGKVIGEFMCDNVEVLFDTNGNPENYMTDILPSILQKTALSYDEFGAYVGSRADKNSIYGWHISNLKIYDKPKELSEFAVVDKEAIRQCENREQAYYAFTDTGYIKNGFYCKEKDDWCFEGCKRKTLTRPPQSWCYVEVYK